VIPATGHTPAHLSAGANQLVTLDVLIAAGADLGARDARGRRPVDMSRAEGVQAMLGGDGGEAHMGAFERVREGSLVAEGRGVWGTEGWEGGEPHDGEVSRGGGGAQSGIPLPRPPSSLSGPAPPSPLRKPPTVVLDGGLGAAGRGVGGTEGWEGAEPHDGEAGRGGGDAQSGIAFPRPPSSLLGPAPPSPFRKPPTAGRHALSGAGGGGAGGGSGGGGDGGGDGQYYGVAGGLAPTPPRGNPPPPMVRHPRTGRVTPAPRGGGGYASGRQAAEVGYTMARQSEAGGGSATRAEAEAGNDVGSGTAPPGGMDEEEDVQERIRRELRERRRTTQGLTPNSGARARQGKWNKNFLNKYSLDKHTLFAPNGGS